jgi:uncharacterized membrane protein
MSKLTTSLIHRFTAPPSAAGLVLGALFWLAALTPSLIPREGLIQGAIAGLAFAAGYGLGAGLVMLWAWLGLPVTGKDLLRRARWLAVAAAALFVLAGALLARGWQNEIYQALGLPPVETVRPVTLLGAGLGVALVLIAAGRFFGALKDLFDAPLRRVLPPRAALLVASLLAAWSFWAIGNGFLLDAILRGLDSAYRTVDSLIPPEEERPEGALLSGSPASLLDWESLGRQGRRHVLETPAAADITAITGRPAREPLRVYVGANSAETVEERAALALAEMQRTGAFDRSLLVISTPTGTGWVDPAGILPVEIMHGGDVASVSVQYSYLPSWLSLLVQPEYGEETADAVFRTVYGHWRSLPKDRRPRLFLFGLSLGSLNSDLASNAYAVLGDPFEGAFWVGPPFASRTWNEVTATREQGSPQWLPAARNDGVFRFFTAVDKAQLAGGGWGPVRILYLQYPSDPIVFFEKTMWRRMPDWMGPPRAGDVSLGLTWLPGISFIQLIFDMMTATTVPKGRGHVYAAADYARGWQALSEPKGIGAAEMKKLEAWLDAKGL